MEDKERGGRGGWNRQGGGGGGGEEGGGGGGGGGGCWGSELQLCIGRSNERGWSFSIALTTSTEK